MRIIARLERRFSHLKIDTALAPYHLGCRTATRHVATLGSWAFGVRSRRRTRCRSYSHLHTSPPRWTAEARAPPSPRDRGGEAWEQQSVRPLLTLRPAAVNSGAVRHSSVHLNQQRQRSFFCFSWLDAIRTSSPLGSATGAQGSALGPSGSRHCDDLFQQQVAPSINLC